MSEMKNGCSSPAQLPGRVLQHLLRTVAGRGRGQEGERREGNVRAREAGRGARARRDCCRIRNPDGFLNLSIPEHAGVGDRDQDHPAGPDHRARREPAPKAPKTSVILELEGTRRERRARACPCLKPRALTRSPTSTSACCAACAASACAACALACSASCSSRRLLSSAAAARFCAASASAASPPRPPPRRRRPPARRRRRRGGSDLLHEITLVLVVGAAEGHGAAILDPADDAVEVGVEQRVRAREQRRERPRAPVPCGARG